MGLLFLMPRPPVSSPDLHPLASAPCFLRPLHWNDCYSGLDLVLVGGACILLAGMATPLSQPKQANG